jgi:hypothetical protein
MATSKLVGPYPPFDYGTSVRWRRSAGTVLEGSVCGFREISDSQTAAATGFATGTVLALVEIHSGESLEIPLTELEPV